MPLANQTQANHAGGTSRRTLLPLSSQSGRIVDPAGRDVLLRGANVNSLAEYWQGRPEFETTFPTEAADWDRMAEFGFSVVRLLISWSCVEPKRGRYDDAYLGRVDDHVREAAARGMYTVIDMHQDVYSPWIYTADPDAIEPGTTPARGWDGAPKWAVFTDGEPTGLRNPHNRATTAAAERAWRSFFENREGVRDNFVEAWRHVAERFKGRPEVAGYDILNEVENVWPAGEFQPIYDEFLARCVRAIREAEGGSAFRHLIILEPALPCADVRRGHVPPTSAAFDNDNSDIVYSPHNYTESLSQSSDAGRRLEVWNAEAAAVAGELGVPIWIGEYGVFDLDTRAIDIAVRYARDEDARAWGGTWWSWRQSYGDPHRMVWGESGWEATPPDKAVRLHTTFAADNSDKPTPELLKILGRSYPWAAPGRIDSLHSDVETRESELRAVGGAGGELHIWTPTKAATHRVDVEGLIDVVEHDVPGGRHITATVTSDGGYRLMISRIVTR